ncbi:MAG: hypothetical protein ACREUA_07500 [Burkholderiales bacterium]
MAGEQAEEKLRNARRWSDDEISAPGQFADLGTPIADIAHQPGCSVQAIRSKAVAESIARCHGLCFPGARFLARL